MADRATLHELVTQLKVIAVALAAFASDMPAVPRLTLTPDEAAAALGVSRDFFDHHVKPDLRVIRRGRLVLVPVRELERWSDENAARTLE